ncbi:MAG: MazG family protein, partial [Planctomycetota bacterium]
AFEAVEAIELGQVQASREELGDVLLVVALIAKIAEQSGEFDMGQIAEGVAAKLIRRHPHVFGTTEVSSTADVLSNWEAIKREERRERKEDTSALAGIPTALPSLQRAYKISKKAMATGFAWDSAEGAMEKVEEEACELREAFDAAGYADGGDGSGASAAQRAHLEAELGDLLIAAGFLGRYVGIDPERATRQALRRFEGRFRHMEQSLGKEASKADLSTWMTAWRAAKFARRGAEQQL